jgi:phosphoribosyl-AMP cyclohydrolase
MAESLQWDFFPYLPVVLQDASTRDVLMVQYMTQEGVERTLEERSTWLWSRSRGQFWMAGRDGRGYDLIALRANCMGDSLLAVVDAEGRGVCHLGTRTCFSQPVTG